MVQLRLHILAAVFLAAILTSSAAPMTKSLLALLQNEPSLDNADDNDIQRSLLDLSLQRALMQDEDEDEEESPDENQLLGKPVRLGGSLGRDEATGRGAYICIRELARKQEWVPEQTRVAVQGFGNASYHVARLLQQDGFKIVAISDSRGGIYSDSGFDIESLWKEKQSSRQVRAVYCEQSVCQLIEHKEITNDELLALDVDLLIPAALEGVITSDNVNSIRAKNIIEVANGPIQTEAEAVLEQRGISILPDVLVNAGGVTVSYFEWVQNRGGYPWDLEEVRSKLEIQMTRAFEQVWQLSANENRSFRSAAYTVALRRIGEAVQSHGTREYFREGE